jgi:mono/diheme cytochrome c family protein
MHKKIIPFLGVVLFVGAILIAVFDVNEPVEEPPVVITLPDTYDEALAQKSYKRSCAVCHGQALEGATAYPEPITGLPAESVYIAIVEGVGLMPGKLLVGDDAANLAVWIAAQGAPEDQEAEVEAEKTEKTEKTEEDQE